MKELPQAWLPHVSVHQEDFAAGLGEGHCQVRSYHRLSLTLGNAGQQEGLTRHFGADRQYAGADSAEHLGFRGVRLHLDDQFTPLFPLRLWDVEPPDGPEEGEVQVLLQVIWRVDGGIERAKAPGNAQANP